MRFRCVSGCRMASDDRIATLTLDERSLSARTPEVEQERAVAIADLLEENQFSLPSFPGPYALRLAVAEGRLALHIASDTGGETTLALPMSPLRGLVRDYFFICESYFEAIRQASLQRIETIDMARRGVHNEGAERLLELLEGKVTVDQPTARRLFTLVCVLHLR